MKRFDESKLRRMVASRRQLNVIVRDISERQLDLRSDRNRLRTSIEEFTRGKHDIPPAMLERKTRIDRELGDLESELSGVQERHNALGALVDKCLDAVEAWDFKRTDFEV